MTASILTVDDSPSIRVALKIALTNAGYSVAEAVNGAEGIEKAKALYMPAAAVVHVIAGGNHAGFGLYGPQKFPCADGERTISLAEQQLQVARTTADWLRTLVHAE